MNYATIKTHDVANGPGVRVSLFVSGCTHHCKNCFNKETWDFNFGEPFDENVQNTILEALSPSFIAGFSLLGGEPMHPDNQSAVLEISKKVKEKYPEKNIWCYSGYLYEDILEGKVGDKETANDLLKCIDILVDGKFVEELKNPGLQFRGSSNQRIIDVQKSLEKGEICIWDELTDRIN